MGIKEPIFLLLYTHSYCCCFIFWVWLVQRQPTGNSLFIASIESFSISEGTHSLNLTMQYHGIFWNSFTFTVDSRCNTLTIYVYCKHQTCWNSNNNDYNKTTCDYHTRSYYVYVSCCFLHNGLDSEIVMCFNVSCEWCSYTTKVILKN